MFKVWHNLVPTAFASLFARNNAMHDYNTRQQLEFRSPFAKTEYMKRAISIKGVKMWNTYCND